MVREVGAMVTVVGVAMGVVEGVVMGALEVVMEGGLLGLVGAVMEGGSRAKGVEETEIWEEGGMTQGVVVGVAMEVEGMASWVGVAKGVLVGVGLED